MLTWTAAAAATVVLAVRLCAAGLLFYPRVYGEGFSTGLLLRKSGERGRKRVHGVMVWRAGFMHERRFLSQEINFLLVMLIADKGSVRR